MNYGSICSGIEAATAAWHPLGWKPSFFSEIEPFPRAVLKYHYPDVPLHGDFTTIQNGDYEPIRLLVGGTPCQSFSIAGLRGGMDDHRGNLSLEFCRLADRLRPQWLVWENVPGVLSSNDGRDFGSILGALAELGYGLAYRVLDAQYFGVPQRRRRVFVVGYFGDSRPAAAVLFERQSLSGDPAPRRKTRQEIADAIRDGVAGSIGAHRTGGWGNDLDNHGAYVPEVAPSWTARDGKGERQDVSEPSLIAFAQNQREEIRVLNVAGAQSSIRRGDAKNETLIAFGTKEFAQDAGPVSPPLRAMGSNKDHANGGGQVAVAFPSGLSGTQRASAEERSPALSVGHGIAVAVRAAVRRLTPLECERLQGFPEVTKSIVIRVCSEFQKNGARVATKSPKLQNVVGGADVAESRESASSAEKTSSAKCSKTSKHAAVRVEIRCEEGTMRILTPENESLLFANIADRDSKVFLVGQHANFARVCVLTLSIAEQITRDGKVVSPANRSPFLAHANGRNVVLLSGQDIGDTARNAENSISAAKECLKYIISEVGSSFQNYDLSLQTLCCSVAHVISSFIPRLTLSESSFEIELQFISPYTLVPFRGKPAADGPRYKAIGNSMAVPVMRWIGQRIQMVESLLTEYAERRAA